MFKYLKGGSIYGKLIVLIGILTAVPLIVLPFYPGETGHIPAFLAPSIVSIAAGIGVCGMTYTKKEDVGQSSVKRSSLVILFTWTYSFLLGAMPFVIAGELSFIQALFESVSGWTTTGLSVADVTVMPKIFLFHRSFMQYCGGLGLILMIIVITQSKQSMPLYSAEGHTDRIMPSLKQTARVISMIYGGYLILGTVLYAAFGMEVFDAVCHTMSALSTAGFTTQAQSIGQYASLPIEIITVVLMLIGASNFAVLLLLTEGKLRQVFRVTEMRFMLGLLVVFVPLTAFSLAAQLDMGAGESFRQALFGVTTTFSTTGYSTMNYAQWPPFAVGLLILLMIIGGGAGSTAGGIKLSRAYFLLRITRENIRRRVSPAIKTAAPSYNTVRGKAPIDNALITDTFGFIACYIGVFIIGTLLLTLTADCSLMDAMFEFASAFGTVGITNGMTGAHTNAATLIIEMIGMTLGRLEIFVVLFGISAGLGAAVRKVKAALPFKPR